MGQTSSALPEAQPEPAKLKASKPIKGLLYAQLGMDSENKTKEVRLSQKFAMSPHTSMKLFGALTDGQNPRCRLQVVHKHYLNSLDIRINGRLRYDFSKSFLKSSLCAKKKVLSGVPSLPLYLVSFQIILRSLRSSTYSCNPRCEFALRDR